MGGAAILMYHRIGRGRLPDREVGEHHYAVAPDVFEAQLDTLTSSGASAVPVDVCVAGLRGLLGPGQLGRLRSTWMTRAGDE